MFFQSLRAKLKGSPDHILTLVCIFLGLLIMSIGIFATPELKLTAAAWVIAP